MWKDRIAARLDSAVMTRSANYVLIFCILIAVFLASLSWQNLTNDEALWHYVALAWVKWGIPPYTGTIDNKAPGLVSLYALSTIIFGTTFVPVRLLGVCAVVLNAWVLLKFAKRIGGQRAAFLCALVFGLVSCWDAIDAGFADAPENFTN